MDAAVLLTEAQSVLPAIPTSGIVSDGQLSIRAAIAQAFPGVSHCDIISSEGFQPIDGKYDERSGGSLH